MPVATSLPGLRLCWWLYQSLSAAGQYCVTHKHIHTNTRNNTSLGLQLCWWSFYSLSAAYQYCVTHKHIHTNTRKQHITRAAAVLVVFLQPFCSLSVLCNAQTHSHKHQETTHHQGCSCAGGLFTAFLQLVSTVYHRNTFTQIPETTHYQRLQLFTAFLQLVCIVYWSKKHIHTNTSKQHITEDYSRAGGLITPCPVPPAATRQSVPQTAASHTPPKLQFAQCFLTLSSSVRSSLASWVSVSSCSWLSASWSSSRLLLCSSSSRRPFSRLSQLWLTSTSSAFIDSICFLRLDICTGNQCQCYICFLRLHMRLHMKQVPLLHLLPVRICTGNKRQYYTQSHPLPATEQLHR